MAAISTAQFSAKQVHKRLHDLVTRVKQTLEDPSLEAVHDLRISIRSLEPVLEVFDPCFPSKRVKKMRQQLKDALALAGQVRDCDVALKILSKVHRRGIAALRTKLEAERKKAAESLRRELERPWDTELAVVHTQRKFCRRSARATARRELVRVAKDFFDSGDRAVSSSRTSARRLHQVRIAAKQLRYALELFAPLLGRPAHVMLSKISEVQDLLGSVNNQRTARDVLSSLGGEPVLEQALRKKQRRRMKRFRQTWKDHFTGKLIKQWIQAIRKARPLARTTPRIAAA